MDTLNFHFNKNSDQTIIIENQNINYLDYVNHRKQHDFIRNIIQLKENQQK